MNEGAGFNYSLPHTLIMVKGGGKPRETFGGI